MEIDAYGTAYNRWLYPYQPRDHVHVGIRPRRYLAADPFDGWDFDYPGVVDRFIAEFGEPAARHWGLVPRPTSAAMLARAMKDVFVSERLERQFYGPSPVLKRGAVDIPDHPRYFKRIAGDGPPYVKPPELPKSMRERVKRLHEIFRARA